MILMRVSAQLIECSQRTSRTSSIVHGMKVKYDLGYTLSAATSDKRFTCLSHKNEYTDLAESSLLFIHSSDYKCPKNSFLTQLLDGTLNLTLNFF